ncbi:YkgJ family cysteine cluster protein [Caldilinea sp.]|jgi:Fe-S-cluster containining protein|uniref:YkgJ family cysteine cluster protein n=1 Tax=Caldilinea sp. TaxID=2293560 RepID=UPI001B24BD0D|nr:YkgJ family cysteine cluster protein [Caldilinea sp.]MBO9394872.1 YkgJ family cysteine cluster protein [Caldilinea sp.]GIV75514.1 MAG: hypothetical protein KatS3mg049_4070 [Caldilinea sp.]
MRPENVCLQCGACCAYYRASFYWAEADPAQGGSVPPELTTQIDLFLVAMKGTEANPPRCIALHGEIGKAVCCTIYEQRPSPCREFPVSWLDGHPNPRCDQARAAWGLPPLRFEDVWGTSQLDLTPPPLPVDVPALSTGALSLPVDGGFAKIGETDSPPQSAPASQAA